MSAHLFYMNFLPPYGIFPSKAEFITNCDNDMRTFKVGETVLIRNGYFLKGTYVAPIVCPSTGQTYAHTILWRGHNWNVNWLDVGKRGYSVSPTLFKKVLEEKMPYCDRNAIRWWVFEGY